MIISPRSRLYRLNPAGLGTSQVESLTSFIMRLAAAHHLAPGQLVRTQLAHLIRGRQNAPTQVGDIEETASFANGLRKRASSWRTAMEEVTARSDLTYLTLLPWARVLSAVHLLRDTMAYCPLCLDEMVAANLVHEPLVWALRLVTVCVKHERPLELACWHCGRPQRAFRWHGRPGICGRCRLWLGNAEAPRVEASGGQLQVSRAIASMLASPPRPEVDPACVGGALKLGLANLGLTGSGLAKVAGVSAASVSSWTAGRLKLSLPGVVAMCSATGWEIGAFLDGRVVGSEQAHALDRSVPRARRLHDWTAVREAVLSHATDEPPITLVELGAALGITYPWLRARLPLETQILVDRRAAWERRQAETRAAKLTALVASTTRQLLESGRAASAREVECYFPSNVSLRERQLMKTWRQTRVEWHQMHGDRRPVAA